MLWRRGRGGEEGCRIAHMVDCPSPDHPTQRLAFFAESPVDHHTRLLVREFVAKLGTLRKWCLGQPEFVDYHEVPEDDSSGDWCVDHVGGHIEMYSGYPPWKLPRKLELQHLEEA